MKKTTALWKSKLLAVDIIQHQESLLDDPYDALTELKLKIKKGWVRKYVIEYKLSFEGDIKKIFNNDEQQEILRKLSTGVNDRNQLTF